MVEAIGGGTGGVDISALKQMQEEMFKKVDLNGDGSITKEEMSEGMQSGGTRNGPSVDDMFENLDSDNDGAINRLESDAGLAKLAREMQAKEGTADNGASPSGGKSGMPQGGAGKAGPSAGGQGGSVSSDGSTSDSSKVYDKKDANKDGEVSLQEELEYAMKHPEEAEKGELTGKNGAEKTDDLNGNQESRSTGSVDSIV